MKSERKFDLQSELKGGAAPYEKGLPFGAKLAAFLFVAAGAAATYFFVAAPAARRRAQVPASRPINRRPEDVFAAGRAQRAAERAARREPVVVWFDSFEARERLLEGAD